MRRLRTIIDAINELVFLFDRHKNIAKSITLVFLNNFHALRIHDLSLNLMPKFNNDNMCANFMLVIKAFHESVF